MHLRQVWPFGLRHIEDVSGAEANKHRFVDGGGVFALCCFVVFLAAKPDNRSENADALLALRHAPSKLVPCIHSGYARRVRPLPCNLQDVSEAVIVESAHRVQVGGEGIGLPGLQLVDKALDVGGDKFLCRLPLLRLLRGFADGGNAACGAHGCFLLGFWLLHVRVETRHVHAERHLAKAGVARRKGRGLPTLGEEAERWNGTGEAQRRSAQAKRGRLGTPLRRAIGAEPLSARSLNRSISRSGFL